MSKQGDREGLAINLGTKPGETMDVSGSIKKIARELLALEREDPDLEARLEAAAWLLTYISNALDIELEYAAQRGRMLAMNVLEEGNVMPSSCPPDHTKNPSGQRIYGVLSGEEI